MTDERIALLRNKKLISGNGVNIHVALRDIGRTITGIDEDHVNNAKNTIKDTINATSRSDNAIHTDDNATGDAINDTINATSRSDNVTHTDENATGDATSYATSYATDEVKLSDVQKEILAIVQSGELARPTIS